MIKQLTYIESNNIYPYKNLAIEEHLLLNVLPEECILYLWQNQNTIVIGRNQNVWKECLVEKLQSDHGYVVRRLSGGGAVYHDLGNLNFTFLVREEHYDLEKQLQVIVVAAKKLGIKAEKSGRNDILVNGKKFSGNAFYQTKECCYHHGTLMVHVNIKELSKYLTVSQEKLKSKGVNSVESRLANLSEFHPGLSIELLKHKLLEAFEEVYELPVNIKTVDELDGEDIKKKTHKFESWEWIYGRKMEFQYEVSSRLSWGQVTMQFQVVDGRIADMEIYSDSMRPLLIQSIPPYLKNIKFQKAAMKCELELVFTKDQMEKEMVRDMIRCIEKMEW